MRKYLLAALFLGAAGLGAKPFEGTVKFQTFGQDGKKGPVLEMAMRGHQVRMTAQTREGQAVSIMDTQAQQVTLLMPKKKQYMIHKLEPRKGQGKGKGSLTRTGRSEKIAGYQADEWAFESDGRKTLIWGSTELGSFMDALQGPQGQGGDFEIPAELRKKGFFPLRVVADKGKKQGGMEAVSVEPGALDASLFEVPAGYGEMKRPAMPPDAMEKMKKAMEGMSPEQRKMMEQMMKQQGGR